MRENTRFAIYFALFDCSSMESRCISIDCETVRSPFDHLSITSRSIVFDHGHDSISLFIYNIVRIDRRNRDVSRLIGSVRSSFGSSFLIVTFLYNNVIAIAFYNRFSIDRRSQVFRLLNASIVEIENIWKSSITLEVRLTVTFRLEWRNWRSHECVSRLP